MSRLQRCQPCDELQIQKYFFPPHFRSLRCTGCAGVRCFPTNSFPIAAGRPSAHEDRRFVWAWPATRFALQPCADDWLLKQLSVLELNAKDVKDHLPADAQEEAVALADYAAAGIKLHAAGTIYFPKDEDADIRSKFEYCKRAGIAVIVAGDPAPETLPRIEKFVKEYDIRFAVHNHGPEDKLWHFAAGCMKAVKGHGSRIGCCIDVGTRFVPARMLVQAIHAAGPRLFNLHMKDLTDFQSKDSQVPVGDGVMPVKRIFEALIAYKVQRLRRSGV